MRSFLPVLFWPAFLRWKEHDDLLCSLPSHSSFSLHSIITHLTHHLIAASHSFTASPTPRAEILARLLLSHQYITFTSATSAGNFIHPQASTKHANSRSQNPSATIPEVPLALFSNTIQLGQKDAWDKRSTDCAKTKDWPCEQVKVLLACASCLSTGPQPTSVEEHLTATHFFTRGSFT